ncbi:MAG TPA: histidine kinase dimerization/phospho-acceptor domain-containing protein [Burkholderiaceae bacterium]|nr:histidine kinase dimerization/phospho-acceptor domain-containing protein [Burkholderiaceae bacterium]
MANTVWASRFAPLVEAAARIPIEPCRAIADDAAARRACHAEVGRRIRESAGFPAADRAAVGAMRASTVFKIKVFDLRGVTVYSSEHAQIGDDASANEGWRRASTGHPASELTHRERFSAFEGVVENRDLISSYVPVRLGPDDHIVGVFELYSDVTPFLAQMQAARATFAANIAANQSEAARVAEDNQRRVEKDSDGFLLIVGGLVGLLYLASLAIVRVGQRYIDRQWLAQQRAAEREQAWHREKMAALSTMADGVSHEVGNPLTVIAGAAQALPDPAASRLILEQTSRIAGMVRKIADFASPSGDTRQWVDINAALATVCEFHGFDRRFRRRPVTFVPAENLPAIETVRNQLAEAVMNTLQALADVEHDADNPRSIRVESQAGGAGSIVVTFSCVCPRTGASLGVDHVRGDHRFELARLRVSELGGSITVEADRLRMVLPAQ